MVITPALRRRTLGSLAAGQIVASAALTAGITVSALVAEDMLGDDTWAGVVAAFFTVGAASSSSFLRPLHESTGPSARTCAWAT